MHRRVVPAITALALSLGSSLPVFAATINNPAGSSVGVLFGSAAPDTITNSGTADFIYGNGLDGFGGNDVIVNFGLATEIIGSANIAVYGEGGSNVLLNTSTVVFSMAGSLNSGQDSSGGFNTLVNSGTVGAWLGGSENYGVNSNGGSNYLRNSGVITYEMDGSWNQGEGSSGGSNTIINEGTVGVFIYGSSNLGDGSSGGFNTITNSGAVGGILTSFYGVPAGVIGSYNLGTGSSGGGNIIANTGLVTGNVVGSYNIGAGSSGGGNILNNSGTINGDLIGSWNLGSGSSSTGNTISNSGTVNGDIWGSREDGEGSVGGDDTITNAGVVSGSIYGGTGNDTIILVGGSQLGGVADGGPGSDELGFNNMGSQDGSLQDTVYLNFENLGIYGGRTILTGPWNFSGGYATIYSGTLNLQGSLTADTVTINRGGLLSGTGLVNGRLVNFGTISPGNSIGTLHVSGSASFMPGSVYQAEIRPNGSSDKIAVSGPVSLRGGTVKTALSRSLYTDGQHWRILSATGGVSGRFSRLSYYDRSETVDLELAYRSGNVLLEIDRTPFANFGLTPAGQAVGRGLDQLVPLAEGDMAGFITALDFDMSRSEIGAALNALSPEIYTSYGVAGLRSAGVFDQATSLHQDEFRQGRELGLPSMAEDNTVTPDKWTVWTRALGNWSERDAEAGYLGYNQDLGGVVVGTDRLVTETLRAGVDLGYTDSDLEWEGTANSGSLQGRHIGLYASADPGQYFVDASLGFSDFSADASRVIAFNGQSAAVVSDFDGDVWAGRLEGGYNYAINNWLLSPIASLSYARYSQESFSEYGADFLNLAITDNESESLISTVGGRFSGLISRGQWQYLPRLDLRWLHQFEDEGGTVTANFVNYPSAAFEVTGIAPAADQGLVTLGLTGEYGTNLSLYLEYGVALADGYSSQLISGGLSWKF